MSQSFFFVVASKISDFANRFLNTVLQCCPTIFWRFAHPEAHFLCHFLEFGRGVGNLFEKKQNKSCYFQNVFNFLAADFSLAAGIFCFFRQFSVCFQVFHFIPTLFLGQSQVESYLIPSLINLLLYNKLLTILLVLRTLKMVTIQLE
mgnify:CR=1 FL=1